MLAGKRLFGTCSGPCAGGRAVAGYPYLSRIDADNRINALNGQGSSLFTVQALRVLRTTQPDPVHDDFHHIGCFLRMLRLYDLFERLQ